MCCMGRGLQIISSTLGSAVLNKHSYCFSWLNLCSEKQRLGIWEPNTGLSFLHVHTALQKLYQASPKKTITEGTLEINTSEVTGQNMERQTKFMNVSSPRRSPSLCNSTRLFKHGLQIQISISQTAKAIQSRHRMEQNSKSRDKVMQKKSQFKK